MKHWEYSDYYKEEIIKLAAELDRWKTMAQRHNPSGCCCKIDDNNGDPLMVEPCAFHAEWRDTVLEALRGKVRRYQDADIMWWSYLRGTDLLDHNRPQEVIDELKYAKNDLCAAVEKGER